MTRLSIALVALLLTSDAVIGQVPALPKVQTLALEIRKPLPKNVDPTFESANPGTNLHLLLTIPEKHILSIDSQASKLKGFTDDRGNDLTDVKDSGPGEGPMRIPPPWVFGRYISKDATQCDVWFNAPGIPGVSAKKVRLKCDVVVLCSSNEKTLEAKDVVFNDNLKIQVGPFTLVKGKFLEEGTYAVFVTQQKTHIKSVRFVLAGGKVVEPSYRAGAGEAVVGKSSSSVYFSLEGVSERCTVQVSYFDMIEAVTVPLDLQVGVGF